MLWGENEGLLNIYWILIELSSQEGLLKPGFQGKGHNLKKKLFNSKHMLSNNFYLNKVFLLMYSYYSYQLLSVFAPNK